MLESSQRVRHKCLLFLKPVCVLFQNKSTSSLTSQPVSFVSRYIFWTLVCQWLDHSWRRWYCRCPPPLLYFYCSYNHFSCMVSSYILKAGAEGSRIGVIHMGYMLLGKSSQEHVVLITLVDLYLVIYSAFIPILSHRLSSGRAELYVYLWSQWRSCSASSSSDRYNKTFYSGSNGEIASCFGGLLVTLPKFRESGGVLACLGMRERFFSSSQQIFHLSQTFVAETASMVRQGKVGKQEQGLSDTTNLLDPQEEKWDEKRTLVPFALRINSMGMTNYSSRFFILI